MAQTVLLAALVALAAAPTEYRIAIEHSPRRITVTSGDRVVKETPCAEESLFQALHTGMNAIHAESRCSLRLQVVPIDRVSRGSLLACLCLSPCLLCRSPPHPVSYTHLTLPTICSV